MQQRESLVFESGGWEVNLAERELRANGVAVPIGNRAFEIIEALVKAAGEVVTKDDLMTRVWQRSIVEDNTIQVHISAIRRALGEDRGILKTVTGRGYRLVGDWTVRHESTPEKPNPPELARTVDHPFLTNVAFGAPALFGRETAVHHLRDLLSAYRVVTLTGPGGIGKTVLASEVARNLFPTLASDVLLVELASLSDPEHVPSAVAHVLNLQLSGDEISTASVARATGHRKVLLVLDNCEHVIDAAARMAEAFMRLCPRTTILATSREVLRVEGECVYRVPPLEVPEPHLEASDVLGHSAVQLFNERTRSLRADFRPNADKLPVIAAICRRLDGIPLAIEFAAARAATLGIQQVSEHLDDRFALLTGGRRTALPRHRTLRATLDWSYELLPEAEKRLLQQLAVFPAGFTLVGATAVAGDTESSVALGISSLVSKSLVTLDGPETARRWRLLETVRVYALEKLAESGNTGPVARRHAEFYLALFAPFAIEEQHQAAIDDLDHYRREVDNLRAALNWALSPVGDTVLGAALAAATIDFWVAVSLVAESCDWAGRALAQIGDAAGTHSEMVLQCSLGFGLIYTQGSGTHARAALTRALELAREFEDFDYQQRATYGLWLFSARAMALHDALAFAREYEKVARIRDLQSRATAAWLIGVAQTYLAAHTEANERLSWAIDHYPVGRRGRDMIRFASDLRVSALSHNSVNLLSQGLLDVASRVATTAIEEARGTNQPTALCVALAWAAAVIFLNIGELDCAKDHSEELVNHAYKHGLRPFNAVGCCMRGALAVKLGEPEIGIDLLRSGLAEILEAKHLLFYPLFRAELAVALGAIGRVNDGLGEIDETLRFAQGTDYRWFIPEILRIKGELYGMRGLHDPAQMEELFHQSMLHAHAQEALYWELCAAISLAKLLRSQQRDAEAHAVLLPVYDHFTEGFSTLRLKQARALLDELA